MLETERALFGENRRAEGDVENRTDAFVARRRGEVENRTDAFVARRRAEGDVEN